jgi:hypothetical protein
MSSFASARLPDDVVRYCGARIASAGYVVSYGPGVVSGTRTEKSSGCLLVVLLLAGILPGILYAVMANKTRVMSVTAVPYGEGSWVTIGGEPNFATILAGEIA